jgi:acyl carrier protein
VRGFRIELGEIEHVLEQQEAVREAVVLAREDTPGNKRLVAYLIPTTPDSFSWKDVRAGLQERLPDYMVPAIHHVLESFPLTPNGKVDRRAFPAPEVAHERDDDSQEEARTPLEKLVQKAWEQVLGLPQIGIHDNFFELGGHSLLAIQLSYHIRDIFQVRLPLRRFFDDALTIATMAELVEEELVKKLETLSEEEAIQLLSSFDTSN